MIYKYVALPMGLTCSARIFTRVALFIGARLRKQGVRIVLYIDDLLIIASSGELCALHVKLLIDELAKFGFLLNEKKSNLVPAQAFIYLGLAWDTQKWRVSVKQDREDRIRSNAQELLASKSALCRSVASFLGKTNSTAGAIPC